MLYYLLLDDTEFRTQLRPALAAAWQQRSFEPCRALCSDLLPRVEQFAERYHLGGEEPLTAVLASGTVPFDRTLWQHLVGEILWFAAVEIPELQCAEATLGHLLPEFSMPLNQAHHGSHPIVFCGGFYRPESASWNTVEEVRRLANFLEAVDAAAWKPEDLAAWADLPAEDREEELAYAAECFAALAALYRQAADLGHLVICETL